jgi:Methyltransferase domain
MHRFWTRYIKPIIETVAPERMLEVGAEFGWNTEKLLEYCRANGSRLDVVDPAPHEALHGVLARYRDECTYHPLKSIEAIPIVPPAELVLLDGDHNWFTVYNELQLLYLHAAKVGKVPPLVLFHDIAWPYARRDMYYDPEGLNVSDRHPYAYRGILPDQSELTDAGLNGRFANALHEGGLRNGVLTGVEDFRASAGVETTLFLLPFFNGLGILVPHARMTPALQALIDGFYSSESLLETCKILEKDGMLVRAELASLKTTLSNRTAALARAREQIGVLYGQHGAVRQKIAHARHWIRRLKLRFAGSHS